MGCDEVIVPPTSSSSSSSSGFGVKKMVYIGGVAVPIINLREVELQKQNQRRRRRRLPPEANNTRNAIRCKSRVEEERNSATTTTGIKSLPRGSIANRDLNERLKRKRFLIKKAIERNSMLENVNIPPYGIGAQVRVRSVVNRLENLNIASDSTLSGISSTDLGKSSEQAVVSKFIL